MRRADYLKVAIPISLLLTAQSAHADTTATYGGGSSTMKVEVASNGDARITAGPDGAYLLRKSSALYFVGRDPSGTVHVAKASDVITVRAELSKDTLRHYPGLSHRLTPSERDMAEHDALASGAAVTVHGRLGTPYFATAQDDVPIVVISHDPALDPLRMPMVLAEQFAQGLSHARASYDPIVDRLVEVLERGPPLKLLDSELIEVSSTPIPASEFELPSRPETRDQVRQDFSVPPAKSNG
jgi:hypothetical protein